MKKCTFLILAFVLIQLGLFAQMPCPNVIINGDFEAGNAGFTSALAYNCDCVDASVCVNANFGQKCRGWSTLGNHTPGGTNYLIVDGSSTGSANVWASTVPVSPGDTYTFSFWVATAYVSRDLIFDLGMIVNGQTVRQFTVSQATPTWTQYSVTGICPVGLRSMPIAIRQMTGGSFRDFGIDDIYFACCACKADYTTTNLDGCGKVQFNNTSVVPGGIGYSWDFGDTASGVNNTSTEPSPIHQFSKCGTYNVCLTLKGEGCSSKICYTVDASDNAVPFIICPRNQTVNTNPGQCYFTGTLPQPSASDNCDVSPEIVCSLITPTSSILITPQTQFPKGENSIVCFARDKCGNVSRSCAYILTVRDNQAPKITCPISLSVTGTKNAQGRCQAIVIGLSPTTSDNCTMLTVTYAVTGATTASGNNDASEVTFLEGVSTVTYTVVDMDGNKVTCSFTVTVKCPSDPPPFSCDNNLVPNPSFEQFTTCPPGVAPPFTAAIWSLPSVGGSSDYYNSCAPVASYASTPVNGFGTQAPRTGSGYAGFILRPTNLYREYLEVQLTTPLVAGNTYQVSFYVSLADQSKWAIDKFGAYLSVGSVGPINGAPVLPFVPQVMHPIGTFISDKTNWTQISGSYTATGGEDHLVIGNFYDNVATTPQMGQGGFYEGAYYYIDDVSVCASCVTPPCDTCECGFMAWSSFAQINGGFHAPIGCGGNNLPALQVPCPKVGQNYLIHGNYHCIPDACGNDTVRWVLVRPGNLPDITGVSTGTYPHFDVSIPWNLCTTPGTYVLHISRNCGGKECPCSFKFEVPPCPCSCDQFKGDLKAGFKTVGIQPFNSCKRSFMPFALCPGDIVTWSVNGVVVPGTTTGNNVKMITFNGPGIYLVCMTVLRTDANGQKCEGKFCQKVKVKCNPGGVDPHITFCTNDVIKNGDFTEGLVPGHLDGLASIKRWTPVFPSHGRAFVFVIDSSGSGDAGHLILNGGKGSFAGVWQQVSLAPNVFTTFEFDYRNYLGKSSPAGTVLEFRLEPDSISGGPSQILYRHMISDTSAAWTSVVASVKVSPNPDFKYLIICVQNDDDAQPSVVGIDNLSMCTRSISDTKQLSLLNPIRIFPNPNPGSFNVELPQPAAAGMSLRITDLAGRLVLEKPTQTGNVLQTVQAENLSGGMYLLQLVEKGRVVGVEKFVKQ